MAALSGVLLNLSGHGRVFRLGLGGLNGKTESKNAVQAALALEASGINSAAGRDSKRAALGVVNQEVFPLVLRLPSQGLSGFLGRVEGVGGPQAVQVLDISPGPVEVVVSHLAVIPKDERVLPVGQGEPVSGVRATVEAVRALTKPPPAKRLHGAFQRLRSLKSTLM